MLFGEFLVSEKKINEEQLNIGLKKQKETGLRIGQQLLEFGFINKETLDRCLEEHLLDNVDEIFD